MYWVLAVVDSHTKSGKNGEMAGDNQPGLKTYGRKCFITIRPTLIFFSLVETP